MEIETLTENEILRAKNYRAGQKDRRNNTPCLSTNGDYLDGWYNPDKKTPPFLTDEQVENMEIEFTSYYKTPCAKFAAKEELEAEKSRLDAVIPVEDKELFPNIPFNDGYRFSTQRQ